MVFTLENMKLILSLAGAALGLLITTVTFLIKFVKAVKAKNYAEAMRLLKEGATNAVALAEQLKSKANSPLDGATKKSFAMSEMKAFCADHKIKFDESMVSELIEEVVSLTKTVNVSAPTVYTPISGSTAK